MRLNINEAKIFLGLLVVESSLPKNERLELLEEIKVLSAEQVGTILKTAAKTAGGALGKVGMKAGALMNTLSPYMFAASLISSAVAIYRNQFSKAGRACSTLSGAMKEKCMLRYNIEALKKQINRLKTGKTECTKTNDPAKCNEKIDKNIKKLQVKLAKLTNEARYIDMQIRGGTVGR